MRSAAALLIVLTAGCWRAHARVVGDGGDGGTPRDARADDAPDSRDGAPDTHIEVSPDTGSTTRRLECVPYVEGNERSGGMVLEHDSWVGFRVEIGGLRDVTVSAIGLNLAPWGAAGIASVDATLVRLSGPEDAPDTPDLTSTDVVEAVEIAVGRTGGSSVTVQASVRWLVSPGWYAVVFGTRRFGAATVHSNSGHDGCTLPGSGDPFGLDPRGGMLRFRPQTPNLFIEVSS